MLEILKSAEDPSICRPLLEIVKEKAEEFKKTHHRNPVFMEVCGSHTMALAKSGVKSSLEGYVDLIAGPGCPVCVTDQQSIDAMITLADGENRIICTFGDMMRVPGSKQSLMDAKVRGRDVRVLYSPIDTIRIAKENPDKEVIFLGIGFETTIPIIGVIVDEAVKQSLTNLSVWMSTKLVEPILRYLLDTKEVKIDGFLLPGHVAVVIGADAFEFLITEYEVPGVITGFEPAEMLMGIYKLTDCLVKEEVSILNEYQSIVTASGNEHAKKWLSHYFEPCSEPWRGIGEIPMSGLTLKEEYRSFDAKNKFEMEQKPPVKTKCRCGEVIRGLIKPNDCPLFAKACKPIQPIGPCMVSSEGSCSAYYQYMREFD